MDKKVVFCTTCKGRTQHVVQTLPQNLENNSEATFVLLDYSSNDGLLEYLKGNYQSEMRSRKLIVYSYKDAPVFHMAHAKNMAHRCGILEGADILVNLDADNLTGPGFDCEVRRTFEEPNVFMRAEMVKGELPRGISGRIAVTTQAFLKVGGYDERYNTWGPDDKDFNKRLRNLGYEARGIGRQYLSGVPHNDKVRFREYPHVTTENGEDQFEEVDCSQATIANFGKVGCGEVFKMFADSEPHYIDLKPIPTRIFGIGMHKTGTTSLNTALNILGMDSGHWENAHWAKAIWKEMKDYGWSITLEKYYSLCDLPITLLYRQLDKEYSGSKFILTTRNEDRHCL